MGILNTVKFRKIESFILKIGFVKKSQLGSHIKYILHGGTLIIPKHKEISRGTLNNIFKIISHITDEDKGIIEKNFLKHIGGEK